VVGSTRETMPSAERMRATTSRPEPSGRVRSERTRHGDVSSSSSRASATVAASTGSYPSAARCSTRNARVRSSSSTTSSGESGEACDMTGGPRGRGILAPLGSARFVPEPRRPVTRPHRRCRSGAGPPVGCGTATAGRAASRGPAPLEPRGPHVPGPRGPHVPSPAPYRPAAPRRRGRRFTGRRARPQAGVPGAADARASGDASPPSRPSPSSPPSSSRAPPARSASRRATSARWVAGWPSSGGTGTSAGAR